MSSESEATAGKGKDAVASISAQIVRLTPGDRAALRRIYLTHSAGAEGVVVGLLVRAGVPETAYRTSASFDRWRLLAHVAAILSGSAAIMAHGPGRRLGRALHEAGYSEQRLLRLTASDGPALSDQVIRAIRVLANSGLAPVDLRTVRDLLGADLGRAEAARLWIARDYYAAAEASRRAET